MSEVKSVDWRLLPIVLVFSGVLVSGVFTGAPHPGGDNAGYLSLAFGMLSEGAYTDFYDPAETPHTKYPPLFPAVLALLMAAGARSWFSFKVLVGALTVLSSGLTYMWAGRRLGSVGGFLVACVFAASAGVVYYSRWVLSDPLFVVLTLTALLALEKSATGGASVRWLIVGAAAAISAYLTRSAGLPLLVAILAWLSFQRRWRVLASAAIAFAVPVLVWSARGRGGGVADYVSEFWMVDPYQPALGTVGFGGLASRFVANVGAYAFVHVPFGVVGVAGLPVWILGGLLTALALYGWARQVSRRPGPAELLAPLYTGLILLWPSVWGGDRFILPVLPLVLVYAALSIRSFCGRLGRVGTRVVVAAAVAAVMIPAAGSWVSAVQEARLCAAAMETGGPFACHGTGAAEFVDAADWMGVAMEPGTVVMSRKPRFFYLLSGLQSRTFPFDDDPRAQLAEADGVGAEYVLLDRWDALATRYVGGALTAAPNAFCVARGFGPTPGFGTQLIGIKAISERSFERPDQSGELWLEPCSSEYEEAEPALYRSSVSTRIPLLEGLDP